METSSTTTNSTQRSNKKRKSFSPLGSPYSTVASMLLRKKRRQPATECTGCSRHVDAEIFHPVLKVPICGACSASVKNRDKSVFDQNEVSCIWCGFSDGNELFMCDTCRFAFCADCVGRNLGIDEANKVRELKVWSCYHCSPTEAYQAVQQRHSGILFSLETAYSLIRPPETFTKQIIPNDLILPLTSSEKLFASLFCPEVQTSQFYQLQIPQQYLTGPDLFRCLYRLSKNLRNLFQYKVFVLPGLFQTSYGKEYHCHLHKHQLTSLHTMLAMENQTEEFDALRGGIFADEPGLGKTVTVLALVAATLGRLPNQPSQFWDKSRIEEHWQALPPSNQIKLVLPLLNKIVKNGQYYGRVESLEGLRRKLDTMTSSLTSFQSHVKNTIRNLSIAERSKQQLMMFFDHGMNEIKNGLDSKQRHAQKSPHSKRLQFERSLFPSCATLIVVPLALLEHWYEQILRHLQLSYLSMEDETDHRGIVYLDGLGDIVDIEAPISRLAINQSVSQHRAMETSAHILANYMIVVTTLERCVLEQKIQLQTSSSSTSFAPRSYLQQIRWLRLVVDEGHDLAKLPVASASTTAASELPSTTMATRDDCMLATKFISTLAAERRWIMSGTPTTGAFSEIGLMQLFYLLCFLRHRQYCNNVTGLAEDHQLLEKAEKAWVQEIVKPCLEQSPEAWEKVTNLLREIMVRHTKENIELFAPISKNVNLLPLYSAEDEEQQRLRAEDRSKAKYIVDTLRAAKQKHQTFLRRYPNFMMTSTAQSMARQLGSTAKDFDSMEENEKELLLAARRPKAIVFSQYDSDLQGVGHYLYLMLGDSAVCEHFGAFQSSELSRFRNSKRKYRVCPLCGHENPITAEKHCEKILFLVEYLHPQDHVAPNQRDQAGPSEAQHIPEPTPSGHGAYGPGGHYVGRCLCSPIGCPGPCQGFVNPLYGYHIGINMVNPNFAIVAPQHVVGYQPGHQLSIGQTVFIRRSEACTIEDEQKAPILWRQGQLGGQALIRAFRKCGGNNLSVSWHGPRVLERSPWIVEEEDTQVLLLRKEGSTGLDLSFATHIFLLERIQDPALRNQIISRAHRFGATGPVNVQLLQVISEEEEQQQRYLIGKEGYIPLVQPVLGSADP